MNEITQHATSCTPWRRSDFHTGRPEDEQFHAFLRYKIQFQNDKNNKHVSRNYSLSTSAGGRETAGHRLRGCQHIATPRYIHVATSASYFPFKNCFAVEFFSTVEYYLLRTMYRSKDMQ